MNNLLQKATNAFSIPNIKSALFTPKFTFRNMLISVVVGILLGYISLVAAFGSNDANEMIKSLLRADFQNTISSAYFINKVTIIGFAGLAVAVGLKAGILNIGVSGQMTFGGLVAYLVLNNSSMSNSAGTFIVGLLFCVVCSASLSIFMGVLKTYLRVNEVVSAIMLNWVIVFFSRYFQNNESGQRIDLLKPFLNESNIISYAIFGLILLAFIALIIWYVYSKTAFGFKVVKSGESESAAKYAGYKAKVNTLIIFGLSGALAGLAGFVYYFLGAYSIPTDLTVNIYGFTGIAVALVGMNNALGVFASAILFAVVDGPLDGVGFMIVGYKATLMEIFTAVVTYSVAIIGLWIYFRPILLYKEAIEKIKNTKIILKYGKHNPAEFSKDKDVK